MRGGEQDDLTKGVTLVVRRPVFSFSSFLSALPQVLVPLPGVFHLLTPLPPRQFRMKTYLFGWLRTLCFSDFYSSILNDCVARRNRILKSFVVKHDWPLSEKWDGLWLRCVRCFVVNLSDTVSVLLHCVPSSGEIQKNWRLRKTAHHRIRNHSCLFGMLMYSYSFRFYKY